MRRRPDTSHCDLCVIESDTRQFPLPLNAMLAVPCSPYKRLRPDRLKESAPVTAQCGASVWTPVAAARGPRARPTHGTTPVRPARPIDGTCDGSALRGAAVAGGARAAGHQPAIRPARSTALRARRRRESDALFPTVRLSTWSWKLYSNILAN
eukprot:6106077-Prymnesium_polylepis.1